MWQGARNGRSGNPEATLATFIIHFEYFSLIAEGKIYVRHFGNSIPAPRAPQGSTPYPAANDLMLTYSAATVDASPAAAPLPLPLLLLLFPVAPLNLIKKLPPPQDANWSCHGLWRNMQITNVAALRRVVPQSG